MLEEILPPLTPAQERMRRLGSVRTRRFGAHKLPLMCQNCFWKEADRCFNTVFGPVPEQPDLPGLLLGHEITDEHAKLCAFSCNYANKREVYAKGLPRLIQHICEQLASRQDVAHGLQESP